MNTVVFQVTLRQLLSRKRTLLLIAFALLPVLLAFVYQAGEHRFSPRGWLSDTLYTNLIITTLLPLAALVLGTAALGAEIDDGTAFYLLAKPISRSSIVFAKLAVVAPLVMVLAFATTFVSGVIAMEGMGDERLVIAFSIAVVVGGFLYSTVFILLSLITSRALVIGLAYVLIWEGLISGLFSGTRVFSVRQYTLGVADAITTVPVRVFEAQLNTETTIFWATVAGIATIALAVRRLQRFEMGETV
jgi:ABC-2 type transport system permease protein